MDFDPRDYDSRDEERFGAREDKSSTHDDLDRDDLGGHLKTGHRSTLQNRPSRGVATETFSC